MIAIERVPIYTEGRPLARAMLNARLLSVAFITQALQVPFIPRIASVIDRYVVIDLCRHHDNATRFVLSAPRLLAQMLPSQAVTPRAKVVKLLPHPNTLSVNDPGTCSP